MKIKNLEGLAKIACIAEEKGVVPKLETGIFFEKTKTEHGLTV
jgi:hypothetical protein